MKSRIRSKVLAAAATLFLAGGAATGAVITAGSASASTPLPAYPATTTLDLGSPNCVTDDVIMNDPLDSTSPITDTYGSAGNPVVSSHATPSVTYYLWYLTSGNTWKMDPPPGTQINQITGVISSYNGTAAAGTVVGNDIVGGAPTANGSVTWTVRDHGKDAVGAVGTEQFQLRVNTSGLPATPPVVTVSFEGNTFNNANGALTIQLNAGSTDSTALTLSAIASSLNIPDVGGVGSTPVTFALVNTTSGWHLTNDVLTGISASDPEFTATTPDHDKVFFTLSGISTTSGGVFFTNSDANPCVTGPAPAPTPSPTTSTPPPPAPLVLYGDNVNGFGNGWDVYRQHDSVNTAIIGWPATQHDPASHFLREPIGGSFRFEYAPAGGGTGLCVSNPDGGYPGDPGGPTGLVLRGCNNSRFQQFSYAGGVIVSAVNGQVVVPDGTGADLSTSSTAVPWGGSKYAWVNYTSLPA